MQSGGPWARDGRAFLPQPWSRIFALTTWLLRHLPLLSQDALAALDGARAVGWEDDGGEMRGEVRVAWTEPGALVVEHILLAVPRSALAHTAPPHSVLTAILGGRKQRGQPRLTRRVLNWEWSPEC